MEKKLLSVFFTLSLFLLTSFSGFGQDCPSSVSVSSNPGTTVCEGTSVTFTATPTGGTNLAYKWYIGATIQSATGNTFTSSSLSNSNKIKVVVTSSDDTSCSKESNILTMTVNPALTPSVTISASKTIICPGENIIFTASPVNGGTTPIYQWKIGTAVQESTSNTFSTTALTDGQSVTAELTSNATCASPSTATSSPINITVNAGTPATPGSISGQDEVCPGIPNLTYSIATVTNATSYEWTVPSGWSGSSASNSITATSGNTGSGIITVKAKNDCGTSVAQIFTVNVLDGTPNTPEAISGITNLCPGISETYTITAVLGATDYNWSVPTGWTINSGQNSNSISATAGSAVQNGNIQVTAGNSCGTSAAKTLAVVVEPGTPAVPTTISGTANICPGTTNTYSIAAVPNATSYEWALPNAGWTGTSSTTSITLVSNDSGGDITVKALNDCGTSTAQTLAISIKPGTPLTPSAISGSVIVCPGTSEIYSVTNNPDASEYIWTLPNGWTGNSSTTSSITVNTGSSGSGNIIVKAKNDCGTSTSATLAVSVKAPAPVMSGTISGPATVCSGNTGLVYTIPAIANAETYTWTLPGGWSSSSDPGLVTTTNSITVNAGSSGNISVIAKNDCGDSSDSQNFSVQATSGVPATPGAITSSLATNPNICPPATGITFSVAAVANATGYNWIMPTGWEISSGANTNSIIARANSNTPFPATQSVKVEATNICGSSVQSVFDNITIDDHVSATIGADQTVCKVISPITINATVGFAGKKLTVIASSNGTGIFNGVPNSKADNFNFTYTPSQNDINTLTQVVIKLTTEKPNGACSAGEDEIIIFFRPDPTASIAGTSTICTENATDITFTATPNTIVTYKKNGGADQTIAVGTSGTSTLNTGALTANTTYSLVSVKNASAPACPKTITGSAIVSITAKPTATISYGASPYNKCITTGQPVSLTGTGAYQSGVYSAPAALSIDPSTGDINPSTSSAGTYTVTYTTPASGGCEAVVATADVIIQEIPTLTLSYTGTPFCSDNMSLTLPTLGGTGTYQGGTYSSSAGLVIDGGTGALNIAGSTPGNYTVSYSVTPSGGCTPVTQSAGVVITEKPTPSISYNSAEFCKSLSTSQGVNLSGTGVITGGTYTSFPAGLNLDSNGGINPSLSDAGNYTITYSLAAANGCEGVSTETSISISDIPSAEITYAGPFCQSDGIAKVVSFSNAIGAYQNGTFSNTSGLNINATSGVIIPSSSQSGTHTVTYTIPATVGCSAVTVTTQVTITPKPAATITYNGPFCSSETLPQAVSFSNFSGTYQTGIFTGTSGLSIASNGSITPSTSTKGSHTVTYTIPSADGCGDVVSTTDIVIFEKVLITTQPSNIGICSTQPASFEVVASGDNLTYLWKRIDGAAITNATGINTSKLFFNNATSTNAGEYFVEVSGNAACTSSAISETVSLNVDENIIIIKPVIDETFCENDKTEQTFEYIAHANGAELTFVWIKDGVELPINNPAKYTFAKTGPTGATGEYSGTLKISDLGVEDNGKYAVKITGPASFTCSEATSKTFTLSILDQPLAPVTENFTYCQTDVAAALTANGTNLKWYASEFGDDLIVGTPTPTTTNFGTTSYWVSQSPLTCESPRAELVVTVNPKPGIPNTAEALNFCLNEVVNSPLSATGDSGNTINWYDAENATTPLASAPTPNTIADLITYYWVSQTTLDGCESDRVQVTITVNPLPILTVDAADSVICSGTSTTLTASNSAVGATSYLWTIGGIPIEPAAESTKASPTVSPTVTTTYLVTGTSDKGCTSTAAITIQVDEQSIGGTITPSATSVCISGNSGTLSLAGSGYVGTVQRWESSINGGTSWTSIANTTETLSFTNLTQNTSFRTAIKNGVCNEVFSEISIITVDPLPVAGNLLFNGTDRIFLICENPAAGYADPLILSGHSGTIVAWKYRKGTVTSWTTILENGSNFTGTSLSGTQIENLLLNETSIFQVEISSGSCLPNVLTQTAILSVIPSDIKPSPVTVDPDVLCLGEPVTLSSSTGYTNRPNFLDQGAFDNASITNHGWRVRRNGDPTDLGFDTDANNIRPDRWKRATRHQFTTANINSPYNIREDLYISSGGPSASGNKGFAIVSSDNSATLETPVFGIDGLDQAILTFDQMYNLTPGASIKVEISIDGGNSYNNTLYQQTTDPASTTGLSSGNYDGFALGTIASRPNNKIQVDLGNYMGYPNLRIRFSYIGTRIGDVWAIDNIDVPDGPQEVLLEWYDYTDPNNPPVFIGNSETEQWTPTQIGVNIFEVRTAIILDSNGNSCQNIENKETVEVFVFDTYTSTATATGGVCGDANIVLNGKIESLNQGVITEFPTLDGYTIGSWEVVGPSGYTFSAAHFSPSINDPNATFTPNFSGNYSLTWTMIPTATDDAGNPIININCPPVYIPVIFDIEDCTTLDFDGVDDYVDFGNNYNGNYFIEAWIRPFDRPLEDGSGSTDASQGVIFSSSGFEIRMENLPSGINKNTRWYHIAVANNGDLWVDGVSSGKITITGSGINNTSIGARYNADTKTTSNHFSGWIEEVRIWNKVLTEDQIRFMMNQHLQNAGNMGVEIPMPVPGGLVYADLAGYYRLISKVPDSLNLETFPAALKPLNGFTPDLALTSVPGRLVNMTSNQENTAPMPYLSAIDGQLWATDNTWLRPAVWDAPHSNGINGTTPINWNIVRINHNINSGDRDITVLGLKSETAGKLLNISRLGTPNEYDPGQMLKVTHYLLLNGNIDLVGESQLLQDSGSILDEASAGYLERDQQGKRNSFVYNYWSSPVSAQGAGKNNAPYYVKSILMDGTIPSSPTTINFRPGYWEADFARTSPITISTYWLWGYSPAEANIYAEWDHIFETGTLKTGEGFTMKGTDGTADINDEQNYTFRGKPHNGDFDLSMAAGQNYLIGNPYPSAVDANEFILDNLNIAAGGNNGAINVFDGALYFWDHFQEVDHILKEYIGGYATYNLSGGVPAISNDERVNANDAEGEKYPGQYIPVGQAFLINSSGVNATINITGGNIHFKNSQRIFKREKPVDDSQFLKPEVTTKTNKQKTQEKSKIRISFKSPVGYHRQILVGVNPSTTNGFDLGYDALLFDDNLEDMYWMQADNQLVIQGVPNFDKDQVLPLGVKIKENKEFRIRIDTLENTPAEMNVYLNDKLKDSIHDLNAGPYVSTSEPGFIHNRFEIIFFKEEPPLIEGPIVGVPGEEGPIIEDPETDFTTLSIKHAHNLREVQIMNPDKLIITSVYLFDMNGNLIENYTNIPQDKEINLRVRNYSSGVYLLKVYAEGKIISKKIIISN